MMKKVDKKINLPLDNIPMICYKVRVYFKGSVVKIHRYPVTVTGKIPSFAITV